LAAAEDEQHRVKNKEKEAFEVDNMEIPHWGAKTVQVGSDKARKKRGKKRHLRSRQEL